jgi:hypothetical protein
VVGTRELANEPSGSNLTSGYEYIQSVRIRSRRYIESQ